MQIQISQIIRSRRRTVGLEINQEAHLVVRAPQRATLTFIEQVVQKHQNWIIRKQAIAKQRQQSLPQKKFIQGEKFLYLGEYYSLQILPVTVMTTFLQFNDAFYLPELSQNHAQRLFVLWYRTQALQKFTERTAFYALQMGLNYRKIRLSNAKRQWGSCSINGNISFCWRLIMAPLAVIDYVVVHELTHLVYRNHNQKFWQLVANIIPTYQEQRRWLKQQGHQLTI